MGTYFNKIGLSVRGYEHAYMYVLVCIYVCIKGYMDGSYVRTIPQTMAQKIRNFAYMPLITASCTSSFLVEIGFTGNGIFSVFFC